MNALELHKVNKTYRDFTLKDVSFTLPEGSIMGFVGENGAGKTTTIKLILNLIQRQSGSIKLFGLDNIKDEKRVKEQLGVVFDESYFHGNLRPMDVARIMKNIYRNWDDKLFARYLETFKLPVGKMLKEYSKGMKMKLSIATALAHHPRFLILDEATSGLDPVVRNEIMDIFLDFIQDERHAILLSSHITSDIERIADYITFIHEGEIVFSESKDRLLDEYGIMHCTARDLDRIDSELIVGSRVSQFGCEALVRDKRMMRNRFRGLVIDDATLEAIMLFYVRGESK